MGKEKNRKKARNSKQTSKRRELKKVRVLLSSKTLPGKLIDDSSILQKLENYQVVIDNLIFRQTEGSQSVFLTVKEEKYIEIIKELLSNSSNSNSFNLIKLTDSCLAKDGKIILFRMEGSVNKLIPTLREAGIKVIE